MAADNPGHESIVVKRDRPYSGALALYAADVVAVLLAFALAQWLRRALPLGKPFAVVGGGVNLTICLMALVVWTLVSRQLGAYDPNRLQRIASEVQTVLAGTSVSIVLLAGGLYLSYRGLSRLLFGYFYLLNVALTISLRLGLRYVLRRLSRAHGGAQRILLVGAGDVGTQLAKVLLERQWMGLHLIGFVDDDSAKQGKLVLGHQVLGRLDQTADLVARLDVDEIIIALPTYAHDRLEGLVAELNELPVNVRVVPDFFPLAYLRTGVGLLGGMPLITLKEPALSPWALLVKRFLDVTVAAVALLISWPLLLLIALWVKLDSPGPVVFSQQRIGWHGKPFTMLKFRTMVVGAEEEMGVILDHTEEGQHFLRKRSDDPRITRVGRFLRRWSLDELPQMLNVLRGEMSIVGPRPDLPLLAEDYAPWQRKRYSVPPGVTGWWQVTGRSDNPSVLHVEEDLYYIRNYSFLLDLEILVRTIGAVVGGKGAY